MYLMSKDLKDLINLVEEETKSRSELESIINSLNEEINRLKFTIKEQQLLIEEQGDQLSFAQSDLPSEINILKELIISQRKDLAKRDEVVDKLNTKIDELTGQIEISNEVVLKGQENEELIKAQELILKLSEESEENRKQIEDLKKQIDILESEKNELRESNLAQIEENEEMVNIKRLNFQLMEENGLLRFEIESLKSLQEQIKEASSEELESAHKKIEELASRIDDYEADFGTEVMVILALIINRQNPLSLEGQRTTQLNFLLQTLVNTRSGLGDQIRAVNHEIALNCPGDMAGPLHPNMTGYNKMADVWFSELEQLLPEPDRPNNSSSSSGGCFIGTITE